MCIPCLLSSGYETEVITGTEGVLSIDEKDLFLYSDQVGGQFVHPPRHYWKVMKGTYQTYLCKRGS